MPTKPPKGIGAPVELKNLYKSYAGRDVVKNISMSIDAGEFVTLLGPSGSGKTTTLNLIAGFTPITSGSIAVNGQDLSGTPAHKRGLGVVFQHYALFPHLTVDENVMYPLRRRRISRAEARKRAVETLELVGLGGYGKRRVNQLSGGQQQRVALARALIYSPPLLLMDEPLGALDKRLRDALQMEIKRVQGELDSTCIFVTHDQEEALVMSDRVAVFNDGQIVQFDRPEVLYRQPANLFVARFLGDSVLLDGEGAGDVFTTSTGKIRLNQPHQGKGTLFLRPEKLRIAAQPSDIPGSADVLRATVVRTIFVGPSAKVEVELADGTTAVARLADEHATLWRPGDSVHLWWTSQEARVLVD
jgi:putative spermidine/putrescine transport system ATP-binding protein